MTRMTARRSAAVARSVPARRTTAIAWNDIEALPIYAAAVLTAVFLVVALQGMGPDLQSATVKTVGIVGSIALRAAWLALDDEDVAAA